ncbi:MAG TPA: error-prone DNA polymerase [Candidatus Limnocylindria bacterium]|jgi:error-prone DNA polymerase|nr:error-prone DNA polymerase [Candidatus Limnocylindria bacterium]
MAGWVELHTHSNYSFLDGASEVDDLTDAAVEQGLDALALTDTNGLYGAVRFANAAKERGLRPIFGAELQLLDFGHIVLIARDRQGWTSLTRTISAAQLAGEKTKPKATFDLLAQNAAGLFALTGCAHGAVPRAVRAGDLDGARETLARFARVFGERLYVELSDHLDPDAPALCDTLAQVAAERGLGCVVTNNVHYARPEGRRLHDVLRCIDLGVTLDEAGNKLKPNGEYWLKGEAMLRERLGRFDEAFRNARTIADACVLDLLYDTDTPRAEASFVGKDRLPGFPVPEGHTPFSFLYALCGEGAKVKYPRITRDVAKQLAHELDVIDRCGLAEFFLINWDIVRFCKEHRIPAQGRGSAADSIVAYVLDITKVDPIEHDLLFERFLTEDSRTMPDIDLDIATNDREEVIQYVYQKYGERYAAMVCNVVTYQARSASRDVAKALGFRAETIDRMSKSIDQYHVDPSIYPSSAQHPAYHHTDRASEHGWEEPRALPDTLVDLLAIFDDKERERFPHFRELTLAIANFPRHLSIHNGGMLITALPLVDTVPIERATMPGRNVAQFDKRDVEDLGLVKMDLLGLRTLSLVKDAVADIHSRHGELLELGTLPLDDPAVYDLICEVDTIGLFQVESRAQAQALPRVRPRNFADIVVEVAIIRPGPLQGNMVNPYIRRRQGREPVAYAHPLLEPILKETLGVILFQEQILRVAIAAAGFSPSAADMLRRAMSRARSAADMERLRGPFVNGARAKGVDEAIANEIFRQIAAFAEFGFCKSHAAAFALTAYHTAHLKLYYPAEFFVALLNNQPMGFYSPAVIAGDAKRHGVAILPVDVNRSFAAAVVESLSEEASREVDGAARGAARARGSLRPTPSDRSSPALALGATPAAPGDTLSASSRHPIDSSRTIAAHRKCRDHDVRIGFASVKGLGDEEAKAVVRERELGGPFKSFDEFATRVGLKEEALRNLALVGAFDSFGEPRRALLWRARDAHRTSPSYARRALSLPTTEAPALPPLDAQERTALDYRITGIPTGPQIMSFYREDLARRGVLRACDLETRRHGTYVVIAGAVVVKQHPETAKGHVFLSLEDETGISNIIIRPTIYRRYKRVLDSDAAVVVGGTLQTVDGVISVQAQRLDALTLFAKIAAREWQ